MGRVVLNERVRLWVRLCRPKFHFAGLLPFFLGVLLAEFYGYHTSAPIALLGASGVLLIMLITYYLGEYFDYESDSVNTEFNSYSGGSRVLQTGKVKRSSPLWVAIALVLPVIAIGLLLRFHFGCGPLTIPLGVLGLIAGAFYSAKPAQWAYRGLGEPLIAICYGWLTVNAGYYLQTNEFSFIGTLISLPIMTSIAAVIVANQFPDLAADKSVGKNNLVVKLGRRLSMGIFRLLVLLTLSLSFFASVCAFSFPYHFAPLILVPVVVVLLLQSVEVMQGSPQALERLCANTIMLNLIVILLPFTALIYELVRRLFIVNWT